MSQVNQKKNHQLHLLNSRKWGVCIYNRALLLPLTIVFLID